MIVWHQLHLNDNIGERKQKEYKNKGNKLLVIKQAV